MRNHLLLAFAFGLSSSHSSAQVEEEKAVLAVIDRFFAAMTARDTTDMSGTMIHGGSMHIASLLGGEPVRTVPFQAYLTRLAQAKERFVERYWDAKVDLIGASMANVVMAYDFHVDGKFSHCGGDVFMLVKGPDGWRIASVAFTQQTEGCQDSKLGPFKP